MRGFLSFPLPLACVSLALFACGTDRQAPQLSDYEDSQPTSPPAAINPTTKSREADRDLPVTSTSIILQDRTREEVIPPITRGNSARAASLSLNYCASPWCYYKAGGLERVVANEGSDVSLENQIIKFTSSSFSVFQSIPTAWIQDDKNYGLAISAKMKSWLSCGKVYFDVQFYGLSSTGNSVRTGYQRFDALIQATGDIVLDAEDAVFSRLLTNDSIVISLNFGACPEGVSEFESLSTHIQAK